MRRKSSLKTLFSIPVFLFLGMLPDCLADQQDNEPSADQDTWDQVLELYQRAREAGEQVPQDVYEWVKQDLETIGDWEYLIIDFSISDSRKAQNRLNELGADRWECIWIHSPGDKTTLIFKRPARSYLRNIPLSRLMKLLPGGGSSDSGPD